VSVRLSARSKFRSSASREDKRDPGRDAKPGARVADRHGEGRGGRPAAGLAPVLDPRVDADVDPDAGAERTAKRGIAKTNRGARDAGGAVRADPARLGLHSDWDFILHLPLRYEDETRLAAVADLQEGEDAQVAGEVMHSEIVYRGRRQLVASLRDDAGDSLALRWLNFYPSQSKLVAVGRRVRVYGAPRAGLAGWEMIHPRVRAIDLAVPLPTTLTPIYSTVAGVPQHTLRRRIERALRAVTLSDTLPLEMRRRLGLCALDQALRALHRPPAAAATAQRIGPAARGTGVDTADDGRSDGNGGEGGGLDSSSNGGSIRASRENPENREYWRRVKFDELLAQQLSLRRARAQRAQRTAPTLRGDGSLAAKLLATLPFQLTTAQRRVLAEIGADLASGRPMHRLLQGDVGSGKTVVAALACARAIESGFQSALMAPTEILAEQHFRRIAFWLEPLGVRVAWLTGRLRAADKRAAQQAAAAGTVDLVIGTHALVQDAVSFARLGLAIVDEQHRFGVRQRLALRTGRKQAARVLNTNDAEATPHVLMLSATPIPRTLALSYLADLDVSTIDEMPPGRHPVTTKIIAARRQGEVLRRISTAVASGRQAYWVCPLVDDSDEVAATAATRRYDETRAALPNLRVGLVHGQLPAAEKAAAMQRFIAGEIDLLVATTVIEVGVDVANATLMVIEHAERFGLAQLHQLRGRVGRGGQQSFCILLYEEPLSAAARERLKVIFESNDGFEIARRDLALRGPGEFLGSRQSGLPLLRYADLQQDAALVELARNASATLLAEHPAAAAAHIARWLGPRAAMLDA